MNSFASGFIQGFAGTLAEGILKRQEDARKYFNEQVEYARTTGLQNRKKVRESVDVNLSIARQLEQVGVPKEVIMAQINQDPQNLSNFYSQAEEIRAKSGRDLSPEEWSAIYKVAGDFKAPDEDLATFISRTYDPIANAAASPDFAEDPEGSLVASMMSFNAMDKARAKLSETVVADGMTADQLVRYGDVSPQRVGGQAVVTTDYTSIPKKPKEDERSISETSQLFKFVEEEVDKVIGEAEQTQGIQEGQDVSSLRDQIVEQVLRVYPQTTPEEIKRYTDTAITRRRFTVDGPSDTESAAEAPQEVLPTEDSQTPQTLLIEPLTAPNDPIDPVTEPHLVTFMATLGGRDRTFTFVRDNGDGTSRYMDEEGNEEDLSNQIVRQFVK